MLSTHAFALPTDGLDMLNFTNTRTPAKAEFKTPGRTLSKIRTALQENAGYDGNGGTTVKKKGKGHTPFHPAIQARKAMQSAQKPTVVLSRPLGDKTPAANRYQNFQPMQTPAPQTVKMAKLSILEASEEDFMMPTPGAYLRPSSSRKSLRAPRTSGGGQNILQFKTPATNGRHWEVDGDIQVDVNEVEEVEEVDDYDEIEYMPPKVLEQPYEPPFDMPDYKIMGKALLSIARTDPIDETLDIKYAGRDIDLDVNALELLDFTGAFSWERPQLADISDDEDPFQQFLPEADIGTPTTTTKAPSARLGPSRPTAAPTRPIGRSATLSGPRVPLSSRVPSGLAKPTPVPRTTSNTPPGSTSSSSRPTTTAAIKRPMTSTGVRAPVSRPPVSKISAPTAGPLARPASAADNARCAAAGSGPTVVRSRSVAGKPVSTAAKTSARAAWPVVLPTAPISRARSATVSSTTPISTLSRVQPKALNGKPKDANKLFKVQADDAEQDDFIFDV